MKPMGPPVDRRSCLAGLTALALPRDAAASPAATWQTLPTEPYRGKQDDIAVLPGGRRIWYGNGAGKLFASNDGGESFLKIWERPGTFIRALGFVDENLGFLGNVGTGYYPGVTDSHPLYRSCDAGRTWEPVIADGISALAGVCGIHILRRRRISQGSLADNVVIHAAGRVGGPAALMRSVDSGGTWRVIDLSPVAGMILDVCFLNARRGFVCASSSADIELGTALMLATDDGGDSWTTVYRGTRPFENCWKMSFPDQQTGFATVQSYNDSDQQRLVIKTTDSGRTWSEIPLTSDPETREFGIGFANPLRGWVGTRTAGYETLDGGARWQRYDSMGQAVNKIRVVPREGGGRRVFAIGAGLARLDLP
jgi:photosystem II stability/assembly factor-like uncharacterized protein